MFETNRLTLTRFSADDCEFILELVNEASFERYLGDKGVRTPDDAHDYLRSRVFEHYEQHGFGLYRVALRTDGTPVGMCGLVKREEFPDPDLGFAFLNAHWSQGYAYEASAAVLDYGRSTLGLQRILAMADSDNGSSVRLLEKLGFVFEQMVRMPGEAVDVCQYGFEPGQ